MNRLARTVDAVIEAPVVPSFTRIGYGIRRRLESWSDPASGDLSDRVVVISGATSGLGLAAARSLAAAGADVTLLARNVDKAAAVETELTESTGNRRIRSVLADLSDLDQVRVAAQRIAAMHDRVDVLIHNAGMLLQERRTAPDGTELTIAVHVVAPFLLTGLLLESLQGAPGRVLTMSSGGMYTAGLTVSGLEMPPERYKGAEQYARAKRAQVTLNQMWAERVPAVTFHALHPGWADTPGVAESLPTFRRVVGPLLRTPAQGADTLVWLAADDGLPLESNGGFWHDRRLRPIHRLRSTRRTDTLQRRAKLWDWVADRAGWNLRET